MRLTTNQLHVLTTLQQSSKPLSAYTILQSLRDEGIRAPTQIYRALNTLAQKGLVHKLKSLNAYVTCSAPNRCIGGFRTFAICDSCGRVDEFSSTPSVELEHWLTQNVFALCSSTVELHGKCALCTRHDDPRGD